jgi:hypothetical protein
MSDESVPQVPAEDAELKKAFHAFKKRLKLTQLETDSKLGRSPMTGRKEKITAIQPPLGFGRPTWDKLVVAGYLKDEGRGLFSLIKNDW